MRDVILPGEAFVAVDHLNSLVQDGIQILYHADTLHAAGPVGIPESVVESEVHKVQRVSQSIRRP